MRSLLQCRCLILRSRTPVVFHKLGLIRFTSSSSTGDGGDDEWNDAWETAWLPDEGKSKEDKNVENGRVIASAAWDAETKAFVEDMNENWNHRRMSAPSKPQSQKQQQQQQQPVEDSNCSLYSLENIKRDYRLKKQRVHATLWMKEIEKHQEAKLAASSGLGGDDFDKLLDTCSDIFDSPHEDLANLEISSSFEFKNKPEGWETTSKAQDGSIWDMSQREEDILLQEFDRRIAFCKFQIASFIKTHIFSRRRPIDGWKYMIEELGPNARKGKGSVSRLPGISDASTQPFKEDKIAIGRTNSFKES